MKQKEAKARDKINRLLEDAGWRFFDDNELPANITLEAKSEDKDPLVGKEQAREYALSLGVRYIILSNGNLHYFWNIQKGNTYLITVFPSCDSLKGNRSMTADPSRLYNEDIKRDYIAMIKMPRYAEVPEYFNESTREQFCKDNGLRFLRKYQLHALIALQNAVRDGNQRKCTCSV